MQEGDGLEVLDAYRLLLDFDGYCKADEGCCEDPWNCDCEQETRGLVYFKEDAMFITYDGELPSEYRSRTASNDTKAAMTETTADLKEDGWTVEKGVDGVIKIETVAA
jgi:hypothetical protein